MAREKDADGTKTLSKGAKRVADNLQKEINKRGEAIMDHHRKHRIPFDRIVELSNMSTEELLLAGVSTEEMEIIDLLREKTKLEAERAVFIRHNSYGGQLDRKGFDTHIFLEDGKYVIRK